ncbi:MAG: hypothetical protein KDK04_25830 [Candidatus Competibacteraceae bacterium]|nr:hypothetical protein [Candidatus Competibacteraceae bacterium]MCB1815111.1 hypothetical protein [Candidatus Competibacteraceae bacterium]
MYDIAVIAVLLKNQHGVFSVVHETGATIHPMAEIIKQVAQAARKPPLDICKRRSGRH